jgi:hypothetical protein
MVITNNQQKSTPKRGVYAVSYVTFLQVAKPKPEAEAEGRSVCIGVKPQSGVYTMSMLSLDAFTAYLYAVRRLRAESHSVRPSRARGKQGRARVR